VDKRNAQIGVLTSAPFGAHTKDDSDHFKPKKCNMAEHQQSKAAATRESLMGLEVRPVTLPQLRMRPDTPTLEVGETTPIKGALAHLHSDEAGIVALQEPGSDVTAVMLPVSRYLELVGKMLVRQRTGVVSPSGQIVPHESDFAEANVEPARERDPAWDPNNNGR